MINASELRIGNTAKFNNNVIQVASIKHLENGYMIEFYNQFGRNCVPIEDLNPIPLSPDILIKCGFDDINTEYCESFKLKQILIEYLPDTSIYARLVCGNNKSLLLTELKSLHQLQNLYFALTKTELNINL